VYAPYELFLTEKQVILDKESYSTPRLIGIVKVAGELHILGVPEWFNGNIWIDREGYKSAIVKIESGNSKIYALADISIKINTTVNPNNAKLNIFYK